MIYLNKMDSIRYSIYQTLLYKAALSELEQPAQSPKAWLGHGFLSTPSTYFVVGGLSLAKQHGALVSRGTTLTALLKAAFVLETDVVS